MSDVESKSGDDRFRRARALLTAHQGDLRSYWRAMCEDGDENPTTQVLVLLDLDDARATEFALVNSKLRPEELDEARTQSLCRQLPPAMCRFITRQELVPYARAIFEDSVAEWLGQPLPGSQFPVVIFIDDGICGALVHHVDPLVN